MGTIVIACYRPKPGHQDALRALIDTHVATLRSIGLATDRPAIVMQARDGTFVEVFEWASQEAIRVAHTHPTVAAMWEAYGQVCEYVPIAQVTESSSVFSEFTPVDRPDRA